MSGNGSEVNMDLESTTVNAGNHMARTRRRWSSTSKDKRPKLTDMTDGVHEDGELDYISPGQLYSTESGRLFHAGKILIVLVGLPATSKTLLSVAITRYTKWLGVRTSSFHVSEYRRKMMASVDYHNFPNDYFSAKPKTSEGRTKRKEIIDQVLADMLKFFSEDKGQLAVYDALNILVEERLQLDKLFSQMNTKVLFIESVMTDSEMIKHNVDMASRSADYVGWSQEDAVADYMHRLQVNKELYEEMTPKEQLTYVKYTNFGEKLVVNNNRFGYLVNKIVFFLMNLRDKKGCVYFARCGTSDNDKYVDDEMLNQEGNKYSATLTDLILKLVNERRAAQSSPFPPSIEHAAGVGATARSLTPTNSALVNNISSGLSSRSMSPSLSPLLATHASLRRTESTGNASMRQPVSGDGGDEDSFVVWTAPRKRTHDTARFFDEKGINVRQRSQLQQLHPGVVADMTEDEIKQKYPAEFKEWIKDPYHYRFPRSESYHDLAVRMEPLLLEMERMRGDILVIGHESALRVLYGYLMACSCTDIPSLKFTRDELIEISFSPFENRVRRVPINYENSS
ncbi:LANO_0D09406g1_1 [Lachancea nothofagi CBS 11611]|uniref:LANO_0D09406g1_1 n=1 Tax=Lachancea nothofagi CBS 11611 TaxID=1266666 RepID=A0A1G4JJK7_9SACH|nr:LANO_0D09406g1_1 [Lachancea nothofagi CBS 11611]